ncbi:unnamed protein product [Notodromas monacha]|uniref:Transmembrane protein n=1 Tax=Notodromas monacha TaxID=399045 RepID=A0A7R9GCF3_9CRUS|nr:unnamed protein product [Notodromas monacha]CAG0917601.1 unnamed protein product [Notodromas monacha]
MKVILLLSLVVMGTWSTCVLEGDGVVCDDMCGDDVIMALDYGRRVIFNGKDLFLDCVRLRRLKVVQLLQPVTCFGRREGLDNVVTPWEFCLDSVRSSTPPTTSSTMTSVSRVSQVTTITTEAVIRHSAAAKDKEILAAMPTVVPEVTIRVKDGQLEASISGETAMKFLIVACGGSGVVSILVFLAWMARQFYLKKQEGDQGVAEAELPPINFDEIEEDVDAFVRNFESMIIATSSTMTSVSRVSQVTTITTEAVIRHSAAAKDKEILAAMPTVVPEVTIRVKDGQLEASISGETAMKFLIVACGGSGVISILVFLAWMARQFYLKKQEGDQGVAEAELPPINFDEIEEDVDAFWHSIQRAARWMGLLTAVRPTTATASEEGGETQVTSTGDLLELNTENIRVLLLWLLLFGLGFLFFVGGSLMDPQLRGRAPILSGLEHCGPDFAVQDTVAELVQAHDCVVDVLHFLSGLLWRLWKVHSRLGIQLLFHREDLKIGMVHLWGTLDEWAYITGVNDVSPGWVGVILDS